MRRVLPRVELETAEMEMVSPTSVESLAVTLNEASAASSATGKLSATAVGGGLAVRTVMETVAVAVPPRPSLSV